MARPISNPRPSAIAIAGKGRSSAVRATCEAGALRLRLALLHLLRDPCLHVGLLRKRINGVAQLRARLLDLVLQLLLLRLWDDPRRQTPSGRARAPP